MAPASSQQWPAESAPQALPTEAAFPGLQGSRWHSSWGGECRGLGGRALTPPPPHLPQACLRPQPPPARCPMHRWGQALESWAARLGLGAQQPSELLSPDEWEAKLCLPHATHLARHLAAAWAGWGPGSDLHPACLPPECSTRNQGALASEPRSSCGARLRRHTDATGTLSWLLCSAGALHSQGDARQAPAKQPHVLNPNCTFRRPRPAGSGPHTGARATLPSTLSLQTRPRGPTIRALAAAAALPPSEKQADNAHSGSARHTPTKCSPWPLRPARMFVRPSAGSQKPNMHARTGLWSSNVPTQRGGPVPTADATHLARIGSTAWARGTPRPRCPAVRVGRTRSFASPVTHGVEILGPRLHPEWAAPREAVPGCCPPETQQATSSSGL